MAELSALDVERIDVVDRPATRKRFLVLKRDAAGRVIKDDAATAANLHAAERPAPALVNDAAQRGGRFIPAAPKRELVIRDVDPPGLAPEEAPAPEPEAPVEAAADPAEPAHKSLNDELVAFFNSLEGMDLSAEQLAAASRILSMLQAQAHAEEEASVAASIDSPEVLAEVVAKAVAAALGHSPARPRGIPFRMAEVLKAAQGHRPSTQRPMPSLARRLPVVGPNPAAEPPMGKGLFSNIFMGARRT